MLRNFTDESGRNWEVWDTYPGSAAEVSALGRFMQSRPADDSGTQPAAVRSAFRSGWLTFKADHERRRLAPVPTNWGDADIDTLRSYCTNATLVVPREEKA